MIQNQAVRGGGDACVSDYWERHDEDSAWYRIHVEVRKKFFGTTNEERPKEEEAKPAGDSKKGHKLHGDRIDYDQSADRRERPYAGTGKPTIDANSWRQMSARSWEIYVQAERELSLREERRREHPERDPAAPAPGRKLLIEFACEPDSRLSAVMMECGGEAVRVHIRSFDITKAKDISRLIAIIEDNPGCDLWASIPCGRGVHGNT